MLNQNQILFLVSSFYSLVLISCVSASGGSKSFYSFQVKDIQGNPVDLADYNGKVTLVVNTASQCGFTEAHYKALKRMHDILSFGDKFNVLAFPSNDFGDQEPWEDKEVEEFVRGHFKAEFPLFAKTHVKGADASPEWKNLAEQSVPPAWNFQKYLVNREGQVVRTWGADTSVESIFEVVKAVIDGVAIPGVDNKKIVSSTERDDATAREEL